MGQLRAGASGRKGAFLNLIGPQVRLLRREQRLSQPALAVRCQLAGYDISRESLAKIESRSRSVTDAEIVFLANALAVPLTALFPPRMKLTEALIPFRIT